ncbi:hypothetical protein B0H10DRAFT_2218959 [Mycena sp. CBHHK59/15]|nr:hypothetical protein B0H10DRAFT_2218959 [Mycena sp. CBHHK59/15]
MGLINWIAIDRGIDSKVYTDNTFLVSLASDMTVYEPYHLIMPTPQASMLQLWDMINLMNDKPKQIWGFHLLTIGIDVNLNAMRFTMPEDKRTELIAGMQEFCHMPRGGRQHPLHAFQRLAGRINWSLNVYLLLKPALSHVYKKMEGKENSDAPIFVNKGVMNDLSWFLGHVHQSDGIHLLELLDWDPADTDLTAYGDASLSGLGFYFPALGVGYQSKPPANALAGNIFYLETLCMCWCIHQITDLIHANGNVSVKTLAIYTDSKNTFNVFVSVDVLITRGFKLHVILLPGKKNVVADALSRWKNVDAVQAYPGLIIDNSKSPPFIPYMPPRVTLGSCKK